MKVQHYRAMKATTGLHHLKITGFNQHHYSIANLIIIIYTCNHGTSLFHHQAYYNNLHIQPLEGIMLSRRSDIEPNEV